MPEAVSSAAEEAHAVGTDSRVRLTTLRSVLYALARLLGDVQVVRRGRGLGRLFRLLALAALLPGAALAGERVDLFDAQGRRTGYAVVDEKSGRVDFYDAMSRRTGYGRVDETGKVERFRLDGTRDTETAGPLPRGKGR